MSPGPFAFVESQTVPKGVHKRGLLERPIRTFEAFAANDRNIGHDFWLFHGINYLSGNPFPGIYRGDQIFRGRIFTHIMDAHLDAEGALTPRGRECLVWASTLPRELYRASVYVKAFARKYKRDPLKPDDPYVEMAIVAVAELMVAPTSGWGRKDPPTAREYYFRPSLLYHWQIARAAKNVLRHDPRSREGWAFWADLHRRTIEKYGLPPGVEPFRLDYKERNNGGYLVGMGDIRGHKTKVR